MDNGWRNLLGVLSLFVKGHSYWLAVHHFKVWCYSFFISIGNALEIIKELFWQQLKNSGTYRRVLFLFIFLNTSLQTTLQPRFKRNLRALSLNTRKTSRSGSAPAAARYAAWWRSHQRSLYRRAGLLEEQLQHSQTPVLLNLGTCRFSISPRPPKTLALLVLKGAKMKIETGRRG